MHRLVAICLLLLMPLQWAWATPVGANHHDGPCIAVQVDGTDCGCCERPDAGGPEGPGATPAGGFGSGSDCDSNCTQCQAPGSTALLGLPTMALCSPGEPRAGGFASPAGNPLPDRLLRPPLPNPR